MATTLFTYYKVECKFDWEKENSFLECLKNISLTSAYDRAFSFGSLEGANKWIEKNKEHLDWVSIKGLAAHPCIEDDIDGQLYYDMIYCEFYEKSDWKKREEE